MKIICLISSRPGEGKTAIIAGLASYFQKEGKKVGYLKPISMKMPPAISSKSEELLFQGLLKLEENLGNLSPLSLSPEEVKELNLKELIPDSILNSLKEISKNKDLVFLEGLSGFSSLQPEGRINARLADKVGAQVIGVVNYQQPRFIGEEILKQAHESFGKNLLGTIINSVPPGQIEGFREARLSSLTSSGYRILGFLPQDRALATITLGELVKGLGAKLINNQDGMENLVENVMAGSHGPDSGIYYYGQRDKKVVVLRSDRPDMQLAALRTPTLALILAGERNPYDEVLYQAEVSKVPIFSLPGKTVDVIGKMAEVFRPNPFSQARKVERIEKLLTERLDLKTLFI